MSSSVIKVENLGKSYVLGSQKRDNVLRDVISNAFKFNKKKENNSSSKFWAVNDVSFDIQQGERVGIIGHNGAGKSTLLKLLSRITEPSRGKITLKGRVASLLEVGTGFHPDLTGRENIFLNGAILGMRKHEIIKKFDEIVAFSEVEQFLDTPVKRYSSGMYVRLAFSVAAHLEPEVLIVDEVLAVGDAAFQKKCLGKMDSVGREGRTVLFVSHNMSAIKQLCPRTILLSKGKILLDDKTDQTLQRYSMISNNIVIDENSGINNYSMRRGEGHIRFTSIDILNGKKEPCTKFKMGEPIFFKFTYKAFKNLEGLRVTVALRSDSTGGIVTSVEHVVQTNTILSGSSGEFIIEIIGNTILRPGAYPTYFQITDSLGSTYNEDIVDSMTPPLIIDNESILSLDNFNVIQSVGLFSLPSRLIN